MKIHASVVQYLRDVNPQHREVLQRMINYAQSLVPEPELTISYGMPTVKYKKKYVIYFGAFKNHMSVFPGAAMTQTLTNKLDGYTLGKGTIQFTEAKPVPDAIIKEIVEARLRQIG